MQKDLPTTLVSDFIVKIISKLHHAYVRNKRSTRTSLVVHTSDRKLSESQDRGYQNTVL